MNKVPSSVYVFLIAGLVAASQSGNIIRLGEAHPVAITAWRLLLASLCLAPLAGSRLRQLAGLKRRELIMLLLAAVTLAGHFFAWIAAVQLTTVANAALFFAINPIFTALAARVVFGERAGWALAGSIALGLAGVAVIGLGDLHLSPEYLLGDSLALICSVLFTVYFLLGKHLRRSLDNTVYVSALYGLAAAISFVVLLGLGLPLIDYNGQTWLCFGLMALVPTVIGHTSFNHALNHIPAARISVATLSEPALASVVAWFAWGERLGPQVFAGYGLIAASVVVLVRSEIRRARADRAMGARREP